MCHLPQLKCALLLCHDRLHRCSYQYVTETLLVRREPSADPVPVKLHRSVNAGDELARTERAVRRRRLTSHIRLTLG